MIHEGKLNDALNRLFFPHFHPARALYASTSAPPTTSGIDYLSRLLLPDSQFISRYRSLCLYALSCSPLSFHLSILLICLPVYLPSCLSCHFFYILTNHFITISLTDFSYVSNLRNAFWRFVKTFSPVSRVNGKRNSCKSDKH